MTTITIPADAGGAVSALTDLGALVTATNWERAAIVAALVGPAPGSGGPGDRTQSRLSDFAHTPTTLAALGITGLRTRETVNRYRDAWYEAGRSTPTLGQTVSLDGLPEWPPTRTGTDGYSTEQGAAATITRIVDKHGPAVITGAIRSNPATAKAAAEALASTAEGRITARDAIEEASVPVDHRPSRGQTQSALLVAIHKWNTAGDAVVQSIRDHGERLTETEADVLTNAAQHARAAADFVEAGATGQTIDEELTALLNRKD